MTGIPKPRPRTFLGEKNSFSIRFPKDLYDYYVEVAEKSGRGVADLMADVLDEAATKWEQVVSTTEAKEIGKKGKSG